MCNTNTIQKMEYWPSGEPIQKFYEGELCCYVYECPLTKGTSKFIAYRPELKLKSYSDPKNYAIELQCNFCNKKWLKFMSNKEDKQPKYYLIDEEAAAKMAYEAEYGL